MVKTEDGMLIIESGLDYAKTKLSSIESIRVYYDDRNGMPYATDTFLTLTVNAEKHRLPFSYELHSTIASIIKDLKL